MDCLSEHDLDKVKTTTLVGISCLFKRTGLLNTAYIIIFFLRKVKGTFQQLHSFCIFIFFYSYNSCNLALYFLMVNSVISVTKMTALYLIRNLLDESSSLKSKIP